MTGFDVFWFFACEWRCNKEFILKSDFKWKRTALKRRFAIAPVFLKYISNDVICNVKANTICSDDDACVEILDDASVRSGHEEVVCRN
eukprot:6416304-Ditylum_brightwellii.AAC.1